ncbi:hypothetical protein [Streptomyces triticiradicis]|uniref:Uncharacterized protein n=1 Tax=Streptomyces triticiradicis TaxID=2651189 RepID=A0A7J5DIG5_9ACTN|nr:hypothetical protein [Streptomyces triticiradicis]KAB1988453.1 hypothetical protein F8144_12540 [Streptomyces triticiradicis]
MTQSGQGEEPSARPAREGIVLPSDGSEPLLPGTAGDRPTPVGGPAWGGQWGPDGSAAQAPGPGDGWGAPANTPQSWGASAPSGGQGWPASDPHGAQQAQGFAQPGSGSAPLPPESAQPSTYGVQNGYAPGAHGSHSAAGYGGYGGYGAQEQQGGQGTSLPSGGDEGATQYIPYIPAAPGSDEGATQFIPPVAAAPDEGATQFMPPVGPGALPPETGAGAPQYLGQATQGGPGAGSPPSAGSDADATQYIPPVPAQPSGSFGMPSGAPEERQPPAEFDNLFRSEPEAAGPTQMLPRIDAGGPQAPRDTYGAQSAPGAPGGRSAGRRGGPSDRDGGGGGGRTGSRVPVIAAVGIGIIVLGVGAGALLSGGGGGDDGKDDTGKTVAATAPATTAGSSAPPGADPVKAQAVELDKLLADSANSRDSVIRAVANVKACNNLGQAAGDLRDAAKQRGELVTRLSGLAVDKLPNHEELTAALNSGWKASASADNHYAAWADQVGNGKKGCRKGQARTTGETQAGDRASGTASAQKGKAATLWNAIAAKYGLTQRARTQL